MNTFKHILSGALIVVICSCEKIIEPKNLPEQDPRIVVNCILNTDESIQTNISQSKSILSGKDYKYINNAVCELYEDDAYVQNLSFSSNGNYQLMTFPKAGKKYTLKVAASGFESVTATTQMPVDFNVKPAERYDTVVNYYRTNYGSGSNLENQITGETRFRIRIVDDPETRNFYSISVRVTLYDSLGQALNYSVTPSLRSYNQANLSGDGGYYGDVMEVDDKTLVNGNEIQRNVGVYLNVTENNSKGRVKSVSVVFKIAALSEDYYRYKETLMNQAFSGVSFFAEPVQVYNNIEKGMGILAGINTKDLPAYSGEIDDE